jgi:hypothetical protein
VSDPKEVNNGKAGSSPSSTRLYLLIAVVLVVVIVVAGVLLITKGLPALRKDEEAKTGADELAPTLAPTFTPGPPKAPTNTPLLPPTPTAVPPVMLDTDTPAFEFVSAGARPGVDWTGFFGQVVDASGQPLADVPLIIWYDDGTPASDVVRTDSNGNYEIRLADAPLAGTWSVQVLTGDGQAASKLFTFETDENTQSGIQQIQVLWQATQ